MADTKYNFSTSATCFQYHVRLCLTGKIASSIFEKGRLLWHLLQSKVICRSRTTALLFANSRAALREQQIKTTSRNRETDVKITLKRCLNNLCFNSLSSRKYLILTQISRISRRALATLVLAIRLITLGKAVSCEPLAMQPS